MTIPPPLPGPQTPGEGLPEIVPEDRMQPIRTPAQPPVRADKTDPIVGVLGDVVRTGHWPAARRTVAYQFLGDLNLDLRQVIHPGEELQVEAYSCMGDVKVLVPPGTQVELRGTTLLGDARVEVDQASHDAAPTGARLVVTVHSLMGDVRVRCAAKDGKLPRGWRWARPRR